MANPLTEQDFGPAPAVRPASAGATIAARLAFSDIVHGYDGTPVIRGVSLAVEAGRILCLLGPSGCGKSTLLRIAAGLERPQAGTVTIGDIEVTGPGRFVPPERRGVGMMFQDYALFPHMTILANVMFGLTSLDRRAAERVARAALARVGLERHAEDYPHHLSGGEQQRAALARAIVPRPGVILMDEPFSGLDSRLRDSVREETLAVLRETRATAVIVTHDPEEAMRMGDRLALMRKGRVVQVDTPEAVYAAPVDLQAARFFSELNEIKAVVQDGGADSPLGRFPVTGVADGTAVTVCVRLPGILLDPPGGGAAGRIVSRRFLGTVWLAELAVEGIDGLVRARLRNPGSMEVGRDVQVAADPRDVLIFPSNIPGGFPPISLSGG